jgi:hypothetical protein
MKKSILLYLVCSAAAAFGASDYFPSKVGTTWKFDYVSFIGHGSGGLTDSGIVSWVVTSIDRQGNEKIVTIVQQRKLRRSIYNMLTDPNNKYDSIFNPPRELPPENIVFVDSGNMLYRKYSRDKMQTTEVLVHDKTGTIPSSICVKDTSIEVLMAIRQAALVITGTCDISWDIPGSGVIKHLPLDYFLQCDSIGPVAYLYNSRGTIAREGGVSCEVWTLRSLPVSIRQSSRGQARDLRTVNGPQLIPLLGVTARSAFKNGSVFDLRGRMITDAGCFDKQYKGAGIVILFPKEAFDNGNENQ